MACEIGILGCVGIQYSKSKRTPKCCRTKFKIIIRTSSIVGNPGAAVILCFNVSAADPLVVLSRRRADDGGPITKEDPC